MWSTVGAAEGHTVYCETAILCRVPFLVLLPRPGHYDIPRVLLPRFIPCAWQEETNETHLRVGLDLKPAVAKMTLASEGVDGGRVVVPDLLLFRIVTYTHPNMSVACSAG